MTDQPASTDPPDVFGKYSAVAEFRTTHGAPISLRVTVEGSALGVERVIAAAADVFREDAER